MGFEEIGAVKTDLYLCASIILYYILIWHLFVDLIEIRFIIPAQFTGDHLQVP